MSEGPKLFSNKPKKSQLKPVSPSPQSSSSSSMAQPSSHTPPPLEPPRESFARRYKFVWPLLLAVNLGVGAYLFMRTKKKNSGVEEEVSGVPPTPTPSPSTAAVTVPVTEKTPSLPPVVEPVMLRDPIPENQQRELYKWLLEEKRKVKPKDAEEKKRIDEEKAILKQFIRTKSIPSL
ncbi:uncharacterized protein LOC131298027 [Rhododendron vialii]|uniref:uncharacterized protein LOC131298027 n=1 Tax=Rhododendron vialii TaxID=182163 RepID=UPI0026602DFA|nr:uncharacterized protein LOC131298027 [Rhododendron vialii]